jgi:hypothetical protein
MLRRVVDWMFRDRTTGRIVVMQWPNLPLGLYLVATILRVVLHPHGTVAGVLAVVGTTALAWWAVDEVLRGVNPFRRGLGAVVLLATLLGLVARIG